MHICKVTYVFKKLQNGSKKATFSHNYIHYLQLNALFLVVVPCHSHKNGNLHFKEVDFKQMKNAENA
jgi:hypothetical protein